MSDNKSARRRLEQLFGKICFIEELGIRNIPKEERRKIKGYTKYDDVITFHHIKERSKGGKATPENGALLKGYNHRWFHTLSPETQAQINNCMLEFKATVLQTTGKGLQTESPISIPIEFNQDETFIEIPLLDIDEKVLEKRKFNRAKQKRKSQQLIDEELSYIEEEDYYDER